MGRGGGRRTQRGHLHGRRSPSLLSSRQIQHTSSSARDGTGRGAGGGRQRTGEREEWGMHASRSSGFVARRGFADESRGVPSSQMASDLVLRGSAPTMARRSSSFGAFRAARGPVVVRGRGSPGDNLEIDRLRERRARARRGSARANDRANFSASEEYRGRNPRARSGETKSRARAAMVGASEGSVLFCAGQRC